jgi:hypothetical protein
VPDLFAQFVKGEEQADGTLRLAGIIQDGLVPDCQGERLDYFASKPHFQAWSDRLRTATEGRSLGNIRAQHNRYEPVGVVKELRFDDAQQQVRVSALIVEKEAVRMCLAGAYSGFSIGGDYIQKTPDIDEHGEPRRDMQGRPVVRFTAKPVEVSLVDLPCCPTATFEIQKCGGVTRVCRFASQKSSSEEVHVNASDHSSLAKKHRALAGFLKSAGDACSEIASHHERMGNLAPSTFGQANPVETAARGAFSKNWDDTSGFDAAGGLSRH